ncbi:hypothetical protein LUZ61_017055 [Rhynchospora tenuis]|uniref:F-box domain-containing protein n=1 Tax=Rhynchospora tenuis TaxID=198213 RepID=A0AAD5Z6P8_9POAL|nr:hypothetical protein LUZ61_017055 [Rhynchospora tenuis]
MSMSESPPFPFLSLPIHLQERILSLLPVSYLLPFLSVSRAFLSLLRSPTFPPPPPDLFFLLFCPISPPFPSLLSFHASSFRWLSLPIPSNSPLSLSRPFATSSSLAVSSFPLLTGPLHGCDRTGESLVAARMFSSRPPQEIPPMIRVGDPYVLAVIPDPDVPPSSGPSDHFQVIAASSSKGGVFSQVYDSRHGEWVPTGEILCQFVVLGNTALVNRSLYVHAYMPDQLLQFDLISYKWKFIIAMPENMMSSHIFSYGQNIYLVAGFEDLGVISAVRVLMLDWGESREPLGWREISFLSEKDEVFSGFTGGCCWLFHFEAVDRDGLVCLHNSLTNEILFFDVRDRSWVLVPPCSLPSKDTKWYGHATEMGLEVLRPVGA